MASRLHNSVRFFATLLFENDKVLFVKVKRLWERVATGPDGLFCVRLDECSFCSVFVAALPFILCPHVKWDFPRRSCYYGITTML